MNKFITSLWFNTEAEDAMNFYTSIFKDSKILNVSRYTKEGRGQEDSVLTVNFEINGQEFMGINGGPQYKFTPAISFVINCENQEEVDYYWEKLSTEGEEGQCGWLIDKFGLSWQVVPTILGKLMSDPDKEKAGRVTSAMLTMNKLDIAKLKEVYNS